MFYCEIEHPKRCKGPIRSIVDRGEILHACEEAVAYVTDGYDEARMGFAY